VDHRDVRGGRIDQLRAGDGVISVNPERAKSAARRQVRIGDRRFGVTGCAGDIFYYAPLVRPSLHVEEACPATGTPIRLVFTSGRVESVDPTGAVVPTSPVVCAPAETARDIEEVDAKLCVQMPLMPLPRRLRDGSTPTPAAGSSPSGRCGT
jgi:hypothetical protein